MECRRALLLVTVLLAVLTEHRTDARCGRQSQSEAHARTAIHQLCEPREQCSAARGMCS